LPLATPVLPAGHEYRAMVQLSNTFTEREVIKSSTWKRSTYSHPTMPVPPRGVWCVRKRSSFSVELVGDVAPHVPVRAPVRVLVVGGVEQRLQLLLDLPLREGLKQLRQRAVVVAGRQRGRGSGVPCDRGDAGARGSRRHLLSVVAVVCVRMMPMRCLCVGQSLKHALR